uniref:DUF1638 domain-containing protein n=1 Tax=Yoonia sp. TaxID=2212373 RepID=UPI0040472083|tara:strand:+ start:270 stop:902 length:633 start_codon:yes stop_codon:yes gene_type:complete
MTDLPSDSTLTTTGFAAHTGGKVLLLACGALAREILAIKDANGLDHLDLQCLPAIYHNHPDRIIPAIEQAVVKHRAGYDKIFVVYADCGTGGQLLQKCGDLGIEMLQGPHCYSFFETNDIFAARDEMTAFYLTDFLVRQFDAFVWEPLGLDKHPALRDMYFGNYTKLVYQAQTDDPALLAKAEHCAARLGLAFEHRFTGYGDLQTALNDL